MEKIDIKSMEYGELLNYFISIGEKKFRCDQVFGWFHNKLITSFDEMSNISKDLKEKLNTETELVHLKVIQKLISQIDGTEKFLFQLKDHNVIESVLMKYKHGNSVCISSQVGCKMGCTFCASTIGGLVRNLRASEMLEQVYSIQRESGERVSNVVIMGTGEPLDNFDELMKFISVITDEKGLNISIRNITVSTCGLVDKIKTLADKKIGITLAISLHASNDEIRKKTMPIAKKFSIEELLDACKYYIHKTNRRITFEYSLISGVNDTKKDAEELCKLLKGLLCHVNLIPINPIKERNYQQGSKESIVNFKSVLEKNGITATIRRELGRDIQAACGQLRKSYGENRIEK
ncbi:23S rRNA m(2)A-2503 methyltransferase [Natranaerovirga pectinivora]|uniref:Probable dual-specificity RNA methyltransferase RlmN n=1 Tax=Natranaerovirga pectinivora TaxID=682400 RepID=A0A4R3MUH8_9FIRM|nr:23S rRNA (adenine(2503)-C(2))-methyltransferase RlmN [Natranaerovirga pectinivora]TCT16946.1 23S rRNA m(2)A-2503 methyltransferase [Natranaerovirga pectinivora]